MQPGYALWRVAHAVPPRRPQHAHRSAGAHLFALQISSMETHETHRGVADDRWGELMTAARNGDGRAYVRLLAEVAAWLRRYYARRLPPSHIDDVVQEALVAIHLKRHTYEPECPFRAWMAGIARYKWIDRLRSIDRDRFDYIEGLEIRIEAHGAAVAANLDVQHLLTRLKPAQADVIRLVKLEGYSIEEASAATGQSVALVKINIHRGIARLVSEIDSDEGLV